MKGRKDDRKLRRRLAVWYIWSFSDIHYYVCYEVDYSEVELRVNREPWTLTQKCLYSSICFQDCLQICGLLLTQYNSPTPDNGVCFVCSQAAALTGDDM